MIDPDVLVGEILDRRFLLTEFLGSGSFGWVFAAEELVSGEAVGTCAVKVLRPRNETEMREVLGEIRAMAALSRNHAGLVAFGSAGEIREGPLQGCLYLSMELAEGSLADVLRTCRRMSPQEASKMARELGEALAFLHDQGVVHRDVKPENLFFAKDRWKLGDLGLVRPAEASVMTASGTKGTPSYMSPEAFLGKVGPGVDVWALGVMVQECLTGVRAYEAGSVGELARAVALEEPTIVPGLPGLFDAVVRGCLVKDPSARWSAARVVESMAGHSGRQVYPASARPPRAADPAKAPQPGAAPPAPSEAPPRLTPLKRKTGGFQEFRNDKDGSVLVLVPAGPFSMGASGPESRDHERPVHTVNLPAYGISKHPVTNEQFLRFVTATGYEAGPDRRKYAARWGSQAPVACVSWDDAWAYCAWAGLRLPSEAEWEKAARGTGGLTYPWGHDWDPQRAWFAGNSQGHAWPVGTQPRPPLLDRWFRGSKPGASPYGCFDMAGNVREWCSSLFMPYPYRPEDGREDLDSREFRVLRGGSWEDGLLELRSSARSRKSPASRDCDHGFRVAVSVGADGPGW